MVVGDIFINAGGHHLLDAELETPFLRINFKHLSLDGLADFEHVLRMIDSLLCADVADMNHAFDSFSDLHEYPEVGQTRDWTVDHCTGGELPLSIGPRVAQRLFQSQGHSSLVDVQT